MKAPNLSSSAKPTNRSITFPLLMPMTVGTALTPYSIAMSPRSSISTMARSTVPSVAAMAASSLKNTKIFSLICLIPSGKPCQKNSYETLPRGEKFAGAAPSSAKVDNDRTLTLHYFCFELILVLNIINNQRYAWRRPVW